LSQSLAVNLSGNSVNFTLTAGSANNPGSTSITATTTWTLRPSVGSIKLYAFFASSTSALTDGAGDNIPSSAFFISDNGGASTALTNNLRLQLPHTVYLLPKQSVEKPEIHVTRAELNPASGKVLIEVENTGDNFGRVLETQLVYAKKKQEAPGFPVFPHSKRVLEVALEEKAEGEKAPVEVTLQFQTFKVEEKLQRGLAVAAAAQIPAAAQGTKP
jgi:hypothetical protein